MAEVAVENVSSAATTEPGAENEKSFKAMRQVEFYFADSNLPFDKFMWTLHSKTAEHWVPIQTIASFRRMREYQSEGLDWLVKALEQSTAVEIDEEKVNVRRITEVKEPKNSFERSIYTKGFGDEEPTLQTRLQDFFNKYGKTNAVRMRRDETKKFKGSVFVEFADFSSVDAFLKADPKPAWEEKELTIMTKADYCDMKIKEKGLTGKAAKNRRESMIRTRGFNAFQEIARAKDAAGSDEKPADEPPKEVFLDFMGKNLLIRKDAEGNGTVDVDEVPFVKGATLRFDGCGGDVSWSEIKDPLKSKFDNRAPYIKYSRGDDFGLVGFQKALSEEEITLVKETVKTINKNDVTWTAPSDEVEKQFQIERAQAAAKGALNSVRGSSSSTRGKGGHGGGRGGQGGGRGGRDRVKKIRIRGPPGRVRGEKRNNDKSSSGEKKEEQAQAGDKRKRRAVEPDGAPDTGVRGVRAPPTLAAAGTSETAAKKAKTDGGEAIAAS